MLHLPFSEKALQWYPMWAGSKAKEAQKALGRASQSLSSVNPEVLIYSVMEVCSLEITKEITTTDSKLSRLIQT